MRPRQADVVHSANAELDPKGSDCLPSEARLAWLPCAELEGGLRPQLCGSPEAARPQARCIKPQSPHLYEAACVFQSPAYVVPPTFVSPSVLVVPRTHSARPGPSASKRRAGERENHERIAESQQPASCAVCNAAAVKCSGAATHAKSQWHAHNDEVKRNSMSTNHWLGATFPAPPM